ncbi:Uncharacterised protein [Escherichia coli]|nr:Uncharacterised protein [Escherichia coli]
MLISVSNILLITLKMWLSQRYLPVMTLIDKKTVSLQKPFLIKLQTRPAQKRVGHCRLLRDLCVHFLNGGHLLGSIRIQRHRRGETAV